MTDGTIAIDRAALKVLASDTRIEILKLLDRRRFTVTEIARELKLNKATCYEHLEKLTDVQLVQKLEDDRKWVYYQLSWKGRRLLHPEKMAIALMLSTALGAALAGMASFWVWVTGTLQEIIPEGPDGGINPESGGDGARAADATMAQPAPVAPQEPMTELVRDPTFMWLAIALLVIVIGLAVGSYVMAKRAKTQSASAA